MSPFQMWIEIAGVLFAGGAAAVLVMRVSELRPKAANWKIPEPIDARLEEILKPEHELPAARESSRRGMRWKSIGKEPVAIVMEEEKGAEVHASDVTEALAHEGFLVREEGKAADVPVGEADAMVHRLEESHAVYSHEKYYS